MVGALCKSNPGPFSDGWGFWPGQPAPVPRLELPEPSEALGMPVEERIGLEYKEAFLPTLAMAGEEHEAEGIRLGE